MAPPWRHDRSFEKAAKNRRPFLGFGRRARGLRGRPTCRLTFNSPPLTLYSPALRVSAGKSGVGEGECQVSWMQISVSFWCQAIVGASSSTCGTVSTMLQQYYCASTRLRITACEDLRQPGLDPSNPVPKPHASLCSCGSLVSY